MANRTKWWEYCSNCSFRVELLFRTNRHGSGEFYTICAKCGKEEIVDITAQHRPE